MKLSIRMSEFNKSMGTLVVTREDSDPKYHGIAHAKGEHLLFCHIKRLLCSLGIDVIKKRAQKDGHMIGDEYQPYIRSRKGGSIMIYSDFYAIRGANEHFNDGSVCLAIQCDEVGRELLLDKLPSRQAA